MTKILSRSPWFVHYNCNSCNGCDIELLACLTPMYGVERFGILHAGDPQQAHMLGRALHRAGNPLDFGGGGAHGLVAFF